MVNARLAARPHERARAVGPVHARRLRRRQRRVANVGAREQHAIIRAADHGFDRRPTGDMTKVFGDGLAEWNEARGLADRGACGTAARDLAQTDFVGIAIHCAARRRHLQRATPNARPDPLPDEPGGYTRLQGALRREVRQPGDQRRRRVPSNEHERRARSPTRSASRASRASTACSRRSRSATSRRCRRPASRSRSATSRTRTTTTGVAGADPTGTFPRHRARARPTTSSSCTTTTRRSRRSSTGSPNDGITKDEHALRGHRRGGRPLRRRQLDRRHVEPHVLQPERDHHVSREPDRRGQREPRRAAAVGRAERSRCTPTRLRRCT